MTGGLRSQNQIHRQASFEMGDIDLAFERRCIHRATPVRQHARQSRRAALVRMVREEGNIEEPLLTLRGHQRQAYA